MNTLQEKALLANLVRKLRENGSWAGQTHVQKAVYVLQEARHVPMRFAFVPHIYGPFSFELQEEIGELLADELLVLEPQSAPFRPKLAVGELGQCYITHFAHSLRKHEKDLDFVAKKFGKRGVVELELLTTALYVIKNRKGQDQDLARAITEMKPHVTREEAQCALEEAKTLIRPGAKKRIAASAKK